MKAQIERLWHFPVLGGSVTIELRQPLALYALGLAMALELLWPTSLGLTWIVALAGLLVASYLWARALATGVRGERALRFSAMQVGDELEELVTLENRTALPVIWAEFVDRSELPGYTISVVATVEGHHTLQRRAHTVCAQRGVFRLGPWELRLGDPLGLFRVRQTRDEPVEIVVYPPLAALPDGLLPRPKRVGDLRPLPRALSAETIHTSTTRPYAPGDPLRHVHWRTTARHEALYVKSFEPEASSALWLVPDFDAAVHRGEGPDSSLEMMVTVVASLAAQALDRRLAVGLLADAGGAETVRPQYGSGHLWAVLRALALLRTAPVPLVETLARCRELIGERDSLLVVTPSLDPAWSPALLPFMPGAAAVVLDPDEEREAWTGEREASGSLDARRSTLRGPSPAAFAAMLAAQGLPAAALRREDVRPLAGAYGAIRRWEFTTLGTGRVIVRQTPRQAARP